VSAGLRVHYVVRRRRLLDADVEGADWREVSRIVLHIDPEYESDRARCALARAKWMAGCGYRDLLRGRVSGFQ
jgi:hypothetical protein